MLGEFLHHQHRGVGERPQVPRRQSLARPDGVHLVLARSPARDRVRLRHQQGSGGVRPVLQTHRRDRARGQGGVVGEVAGSGAEPGETVPRRQVPARGRGHGPHPADAEQVGRRPGEDQLFGGDVSRHRGPR
ncbi:hypothetical protein SDC9_182766 [bioreactor metagenome]|uniref:Uncharacterized protein n=1 Tax=bioreactor metagenome TaxID=1076179 RepID=A0A645HAW7_9ZZZZ